MKKALCASEVEALIREIQRYLAYMEAFRKAGRPERSQKRQEGDPKES